jgi:hypothetical protein
VQVRLGLFSGAVPRQGLRKSPAAAPEAIDQIEIATQAS